MSILCGERNLSQTINSLPLPSKAFYTGIDAAANNNMATMVKGIGQLSCKILFKWLLV